MKIQFDCDEDLIYAYLNGNQTALCKLWLRYDAMVYGIAHSMVRSKEVAEDLRQEIFIKMYANLSKLKELDKFTSWLKSITYNTCRSWLSRQKETVPVDSLTDAQHPTVSIDEEVEHREHRNLLRQMVDQLPLDYRVVIELHYFEGQRVAQIAEFLELPESTVKWRIHKARKMLEETAKINGYRDD